ncbi:MAG: hypothetical protein RO257_13780 [Candidatus Kapabacteria bacterium]|nr:hypothetical protein [Candidatus Kapabacteria bacterium]
MKKFLFIIAACSALTALCVFSGCEPDNRKSRECFEKWLECERACDEMYSKAILDYDMCLKQAEEKYYKAMADCAERFPRDWAGANECLKNAMKTYADEMKACTEAYKKAMEDVKNCRQACKDAERECLGLE